MALKLSSVVVVCLLARFAVAQDLFGYFETDEQDVGLDWMDAICRNPHYLLLDESNGQKYDCLTKQWVGLNNEFRQKRQVDEPMDGSGDGEKPVEEAEVQEKEVPEEAAPEPANEGEVKTEDETAQEEVKTEAAVVEEEEEEPKVDTEAVEKTEEVQETKPEEPKVETTINPVESEVSLIPIKEVKIVDRILEENMETVPVPDGDQDHPEKIDKFQDGNTITSNHQEIDNNSDKAPLRVEGPRSAQEKTNPEEKEEAPKTGQATKTDKDSNILIMLFVGVVAVGLAAFGYNFIRKRRRSNQTTQPPMEGVKVDNIPVKNATEQEMHPLMKNGKPEEPKQEESQEVYRPTTSAITE